MPSLLRSLVPFEFGIMGRWEAEILSSLLGCCTVKKKYILFDSHSYMVFSHITYKGYFSFLFALYTTKLYLRQKRNVSSFLPFVFIYYILSSEPFYLKKSKCTEHLDFSLDWVVQSEKYMRWLHDMLAFRFLKWNILTSGTWFYAHSALWSFRLFSIRSHEHIIIFDCIASQLFSHVSHYTHLFAVENTVPRASVSKVDAHTTYIRYIFPLRDSFRLVPFPSPPLPLVSLAWVIFNFFQFSFSTHSKQL